MSRPAPQPRRKYDLTSGSLRWNLFRLAAPAAAGAVLHSIYNLVDAFWLGKVGKIALNAPGLSGPLFFVVFAIGWGFGTGGTALVAQYTGAGREREADRAAAQTILLLCVLISAMVLPVFALAPRILRLMQAPAEAVAPATVYLRVFLLGLPFIAFTMAYGSVLRAVGDTITVVVITGAANVVNLALDPLLIFGVGPFPELGVMGAAVASVIAQSFGAAACLACLLRGRGGVRVAPADFRPDRGLLWRVVRIGTPAAVGMSANSFGFVVFQSLVINPFGATVVGAFTIGFRVLHFVNAPMHAMASAAAPIVGQALGAGEVKLARRAVRLSASVFARMMFVPIALLMWKGRLVARLFIDDPGVIREAGRFFAVVPASVYFFGVLMMLMSAFYGSGHTRPAMIVAIIRVWVVRIPVAYLLAVAVGLGSLGAYLGMVAGNIASASVALALFLGGGWEHAVIDDGAPHQGQGEPDEGGG